MRAVTGRYQKQKHISRHSFKLSTIYHIIARPGSQCSLDNKFGLLWEKKLIHLSFHETLPDVKGGKLHKNLPIYLQCGRLEDVAMFSVLSFHWKSEPPDSSWCKRKKMDDFLQYIPCGRLEGVAMLSVLIESLGKRTRVREWFIGMGEEYIRTFVFLRSRINLPIIKLTLFNGNEILYHLKSRLGKLSCTKSADILTLV